MVERSLSMREAPGSIPGLSILFAAGLRELRTVPPSGFAAKARTATGKPRPTAKEMATRRP